jgi:P-type Ca2+ transporter type 2C
VLLTVSITLGLTLLWPFARALFRFGPLHWNDLLVTLAAGVVVLVVLEISKSLLIARKWRRPANNLAIE